MRVALRTAAGCALLAMLLLACHGSSQDGGENGVPGASGGSSGSSGIGSSGIGSSGASSSGSGGQRPGTGTVKLTLKVK